MDDLLPLGPLTRSEIVTVLGYMGVDIPAHTKLSDDNLNKRLQDALNAAQYKSRFSLPLDIKNLADWPTLKSGRPKVPSDKRLLEAVRRGNVVEMAATQARGGTAPELYVDPFMDLRQTMMSLGNHLDKGFKCVVMQDKEKEHAINIRVCH